MKELHKKKCIPCDDKTLEPMDTTTAQQYIKEVPQWKLGDDMRKISREFSFTDFKQALRFVDGVAEIAEHEGHHPDIHIFYNKVKLDLWTHAIGGLSENDFIVAAKVNQLENI